MSGKRRRMERREVPEVRKRQAKKNRRIWWTLEITDPALDTKENRARLLRCSRKLRKYMVPYSTVQKAGLDLLATGICSYLT